MRLKTAILRYATSLECGCAGRRKLVCRCSAAEHTGLRVFRSAAKLRIQHRLKSRKNGSGRQLDQRRSRQDMIAQNAPRVRQKIHNLYLVVIGRMVFADGAEVSYGSR